MRRSNYAFDITCKCAHHLNSCSHFTNYLVFNFNFCLQFGYSIWISNVHIANGRMGETCLRFAKQWKKQSRSHVTKCQQIWQIDEFGSVNLNWINICSHPCHDFASLEIVSKFRVERNQIKTSGDWKMIYWINQFEKYGFCFSFVYFQLSLPSPLFRSLKIKMNKWNYNDVPNLNMQRLSTSRNWLCHQNDVLCCVFVCLFVAVCWALARCALCIHHQTHTNARTHAHTHRAPVNFGRWEKLKYAHTRTGAGVSVLMDALNDDLQNESIARSIIHSHCASASCECNCERLCIPFAQNSREKAHWWLKLTVLRCSNSWWSNQKKSNNNNNSNQTAAF